MAIEKGITVAPKGIEEASLEEKALEIEIVDPEMVTLDDGSVEITIIPDANVTDMMSFDANLAEMLEDKDLAILADDLSAMVESDMASRKDWADTYVKGLEIIGFKYEERTTPWEGSCGVHSTV